VVRIDMVVVLRFSVEVIGKFKNLLCKITLNACGAKFRQKTANIILEQFITHLTQSILNPNF
jgi:hypothetical protein